MYLALNDINKKHPELKLNEADQLILRTLIYTNYALDSVEYITGQDKQAILDVYQTIVSSPLPHIAMHPDAVQLKKELRKPRKFKRMEMVEFLKEELLKENPEIVFINLKYNVLTCQLGERFFTIYVSTSRDYEFMKEEEELIMKKRVAAWHKGDEQIFSDHDYYALMVKVDERSEYVTDNDKCIEYIILDQPEMQEWLEQKNKNQSGMINCYVHYYQEKNSTHIRKIEDSRETPKISLMEYHRRGFKISE